MAWLHSFPCCSVLVCAVGVSVPSNQCQIRRWGAPTACLRTQVIHCVWFSKPITACGTSTKAPSFTPGTLGHGKTVGASFSSPLQHRHRHVSSAASGERLAMGRRVGRLEVAKPQMYHQTHTPVPRKGRDIHARSHVIIVIGCCLQAKCHTFE